MPLGDPELYFDLGSPYAYLAVARAEKVLGGAPVLRPVLLGAIFRARGFGSWSLTSQRERRMREIEERAASYGLPPLRWPPAWPPDGLVAMRAALWAEEQGALAHFVDAVYRHEFAYGEDISAIERLSSIADEIGLPGRELESAVRSQAIKDRLRRLTDEAWGRGVRGVPTLAIGSTLVYGDDQLEQAPLILRGG